MMKFEFFTILLHKNIWKHSDYGKEKAGKEGESSIWILRYTWL